MHNVIGALRYMAEHGGNWSYDTGAGVWRLYLHYSRAHSTGIVGFTQDEMRAFLEHYNEVTNA